MSTTRGTTRGGGGPDDYRAGYLKLRSVLQDRTTGLPAYPLLIDDLRAMLDRRRSIGVLHLSIDGLRTVESLYGWQVLDDILSRVSGVLQASVGSELPTGTLLGVDRVAGDHFLAFVPHDFQDNDVQGQLLAGLGQTLTARLREQLDDEELSGLGPTLALHAGHATIALNPFYRFERLVYAAVERARTRDERRERRRERSRGEELKRIIDESAVRVVFQPVIDLQTREVLGYEALARGPENTMFEKPSAMFSVSGPIGVAADLDRLCREVALRESAAVRDQGKLFLNVLPGSLEGPEWCGPQGIQRSIDREDLVLEVSERGAYGDTERLIAAMENMKSLGFSLALDDIGTGYASLATVERVRPDYLKADGTLVHEVHENLIKQEVIASLVQIAERTGAVVVAEGVESEQEAETLRQVGARYGQGYLFAAPSPAGRVGATK